MKTGAVSTILVLAGEKPQGLAKEMLLAQAALIPRPHLLAVDGGAVHLAGLGLVPDLLMGDFDSIPDGLFADVPQKRYPRAKNFTDGEAAFAYAVKKDSGNIAVFAGLGGRMDHLFANVFFPCAWPTQIERFTFFGDDCIISYSQGHQELSGNKGDLVSILPLSAEVKGICLTNFEYPLEQYNLSYGSSRCLSNVMTADQATIDHQEGLALIIHFPTKFSGVIYDSI